jgi:peptidoglycan/LPS O-acetylase OafA/YrhL
MPSMPSPVVLPPRTAAPGLIRSHTGMRGLAAALVAYGHYTGAFCPAVYLPHTHVAVDFFFLLSGFVLTHVYHDRFASGCSLPQLRAFLARRIARIYPLHLATMFMVIAVARFTLSDDDREQLLPSLVLVQAWGWFDRYALNAPAWSISCEFAAYLAFPLLSWFTYARWRRIGLLLISGLGAAMLWPLGAGELDIHTMGSRWVLLRVMISFPLGMLLAVWSRQRRDDGRYAIVQWIALLAMAAVLAARLPEMWLLPPLAALVLATAGDRGGVARAMASRPMRWLGDISYGVYLIQWPLIHALYSVRPKLAEVLPAWAVEAGSLTIFVLGTFGGAAVSQRWFERPFIRMAARQPA